MNKEELEANLQTLEEAIKTVMEGAQQLATAPDFFEGKARAKRIWFALRALNPANPKDSKFKPTTDPGPLYGGEQQQDEISWGTGAGDGLEGDPLPEDLEIVGDTFNPVTDGANEYLAKQAAEAAQAASESDHTKGIVSVFTNDAARAAYGAVVAENEAANNTQAAETETNKAKKPK